MPLANRTTQQEESPEGLRPYEFHGVELSIKGGHGVGDCPFCGKEGKFSVDIISSQWRCFICGGGTESGGGNALTFLRLLHATSVVTTTPDFLADVVSDRKLLNLSTVSSWGVCKSPIPPYSWLIPGYNIEGRLDQLYRRVWTSKGYRLLPTPDIWPVGKSHALHLPVDDFKPDRHNVYVTEGPWDGMALWELDSLPDSNIIAVPGCKTWQDEWTQLCKGKQVTLLYDSDHPRIYNGQIWRDGYDGMQRVARKLSGYASQVRWLKWSADGYEPSKSSGYDVRDFLSGS